MLFISSLPSLVGIAHWKRAPEISTEKPRYVCVFAIVDVCAVFAYAMLVSLCQAGISLACTTTIHTER